MKQYRIVPKSDGKFYAEWKLWQQWFTLSRKTMWGAYVDFCRTEQEALDLIAKDKEKEREIENRRQAEADFRQANPIIYVT